MRSRKIDILKEIFPDNLYILSTVENEICRSKNIRPEVKRIIKNGTLKRMSFPTSPEFLLEYAELIKKFGEGESACMAVAKYNEDIIASNNVNDIKEYCTLHSISYLTTIDILFVAYKKGVMNEADVDYFLYFNYSGANPSKIPFRTLAGFIATNPAICKLYKKAI